jgi:phage FluMu protein Com
MLLQSILVPIPFRRRECGTIWKRCCFVPFPINLTTIRLEISNSALSLAGRYPWLEIKCSRCQTPRDVDLCALRHVPTTCVHDLAGRLVCQKCKKAGKRPAATLL